MRQGVNIGASSSLEPLDTIDSYRNNASLIQKTDTIYFSWNKYFGILSKLILYSNTSTNRAGIMRIEFCNENDVVRRTLYSPSSDDIMPILGEMYIGVQCYNNVYIQK